jgi:hypothetical protein
VIAHLVEGADDNKRLNYCDTILFLEREGFIRYEGRVSNDSFHNVTLTIKGLVLLNAVPDALQENTPLGTRLMSVVRAGSKEVIKTVVQQVITRAIDYLR